MGLLVAASASHLLSFHMTCSPWKTLLYIREGKGEEGTYHLGVTMEMGLGHFHNQFNRQWFPCAWEEEEERSHLCLWQLIRHLAHGASCY